MYASMPAIGQYSNPLLKMCYFHSIRIIAYRYTFAACIITTVTSPNTDDCNNCVNYAHRHIKARA